MRFLLSIISLYTVQSLHMQQLPSTLHSSPLELLRRKSPNVAGGAILASKRVSIVAAVTSSTVPQRQKDPKKRVMITGIGLASMFGNDVDGYYEKLLAKESGITSIDRFGASKFPTRFAGQILDFSFEGYIDGKNDRRLDDCLWYCIVAGKKALDHAGLGGANLSKIDNEDVVVLVGSRWD